MVTAGSKQEALRALYARGRAAWPSIDLDPVTFSTLTAYRLADGDGNGELDDIRADELYLAIACAAGVDCAIVALEKHYLSGLVFALVRRGQDAATAADIVQAVRVRFLVGEPGRLPRIAEYNGRGSLATWIGVAAARTAVSTYRKHRRESPARELDVVGEVQSPELDVLQQRFGPAFESAFRSAFKALDPRQRNLLRYQALDRLGIDRIAAIYGVHRATAARWLAHAQATLVASVRRVLQEELCIGAEELESLLRVLHSRLELSLRLLLTPASTYPKRAGDSDDPDKKDRDHRGRGLVPL